MGIEKAFPYLLEGQTVAGAGARTAALGIGDLISAIEKYPKIAATVAGVSGLALGSKLSGRKAMSDEDYLELLRQKHLQEQGVLMEDERKKRLRDLALSGLISGAVVGTGAKALTGFKSWGELAKAGALAGAAGAGISSSSGYLGEELLGAPSPDEQSPFSKRGALGGAIGGGLVGAGAGALLGSGSIGKSISALSRVSPKVAAILEDAKPIAGDNLLVDKLKTLVSGGGKKGAAIGAIAGGLGLGGVASYYGMDEGMQLDVLRGLQKERNRKELENAQRAYATNY